MKRNRLDKWIFAVLGVCFITHLLFANVVSAQEFPAAPKGFVSDYVGVLSAGQAQMLERKLKSFADRTSTEIAVVFVKTTHGYAVADYTVRLAQQWKVGSKAHDNGVMVLAAIDDRAVSIQTGYGVEGALPDIIAHRIIEQEIKPAFRQGDYYLGVDLATDAIIAHTKGEYKASPKPKSGQDQGGGVGGIVLLILFVIIISVISRSGRGGGGKGGKRQVLNGKGTSDLFWLALLSGLGNGGRGSSGGGFGGSGGGFGGFGGGGFGGGGASGRW